METQTNSSTAIARIGGAQSDPYTPRDLGEALTLAKTYAASKILGAYGNADQVMLVMATGSELGIPPTAALRGLYVVEGRIFMSSDLMVALCMRAPQCERFDLTEQTEAAAAYTVQRKGGQPLVFRFTVEDAKRAMLGGGKDGAFDPKSNWSKYPGTMCRHRAAALAARAVFPDVIMGLYDEAERDDAPRDVSPLPASAAGASRTSPASVAGRAPSQPIDAEVVDENETRVVKALETATDKTALDAAVKEALRIWPTVRPKAVSDAHVAAKKRVAAPAATASAPTPAAPPAETPTPPHDEKTGEVREPGEDDA